MSKKKARDDIAPQEILERFVVRARRVQAHSLVQDGSVEKYAKTQMTVSFSMTTGAVTIKDVVVPDEEAFESLTTRLRPFIVKSEPIYLPNVFAAIRSSVPVDALGEKDEDLERALASAEQRFEHRFCEQDVKTYAIQLLDEEGNPESGYVSDAVMADSWLYTDTVHADPHGAKAEGKKFGYRARYTAASPFFCELAILVVSMLNIVKALVEKGYLTISDTAWSEPVTYAEAEEAAGEKVVEGSMRVFPVGTVPPDGARLEDIPGGVEATPMVLGLLADPEGRAVLTVHGESGEPIASYPAYRRLGNDTFVFLVNDILSLTVPRDILSGRPSAIPIFEANERRADEAYSLLGSFSSPRRIEVRFNYDGKEQRFMLSFELSSAEGGESSPKDGER
jgi:hypothetical protein